MDECELHAQAVRNGSRALGATGIGTDDDSILPVGNVLLDVSLKKRLSVEVIDGDIEESLDYTGNMLIYQPWPASWDERTKVAQLLAQVCLCDLSYHRVTYLEDRGDPW